MNFIDLQQAFNDGRIEKKLYWQLIRENFTSVLAQFPEVIRNGKDIKRINIDTNGCYLEDNEGMKIPFFFDETVCRAEAELSFGVDYEKEDMKVVAGYLNATGAEYVFDIGANAGLYSLSLDKMTSGISYYLFEPLPTTFEKPEKTIDLNNADTDRFHLNNCGMSDKRGSFDFYLPGASEAASLRPVNDEFYLKQSEADGSYTGQNVMQRIPCQVTTVDDYVKENDISKIDFIKIDVEGNERFVLEGAHDTLNRLHPFVYCELLRKHSRRFGYHPNDVIAYMKDLGYDCLTIHDGELTDIKEITDETVETNFFFATKEQKEVILR